VVGWGDRWFLTIPLPLFCRNLKRVLSLRIYMDEGEAEGEGQQAVVEPHLVFDLQCEVGVLKRHHFQLQDCEIVHALFHRQGNLWRGEERGGAGECGGRRGGATCLSCSRTHALTESRHAPCLSSHPISPSLSHPHT
jgi:hypothetical protein